MRGIRNKVIHDYLDVAWDVVSKTVREDLPPPLLNQVRSLLKGRVKCIRLMEGRNKRMTLHG
jgi:uncharacterized protein with HEPN domain